MSKILDGKIVRDEKAKLLKEKISKLGFSPCLAIIQVGDRPESTLYVKMKKKFGESIGAEVRHFQFNENVSEGEVIGKIKDLNADKKINGVMIQLPLPEKMDKEKIIGEILPGKDVDGLTGGYLKNLFNGETDGLVSATAKGIISLLDFYGVSLKGKNVAVVNHSSLVGKPLALLLLAKGATPTICHIDTKNLAEITKRVDIIVSATGQAKMIDENFVSKGQVVIDAGAGLDKDGKVSGDVDFEKVKNIVSAVSPVPGGVGPMTVLSLFENLVYAMQINEWHTNVTN
jgi:methylenetetrahydrofolate dehydrogenase (NADP+)/methenyltetrahydrofolate cyclohydrolase